MTQEHPLEDGPEEPDPGRQPPVPEMTPKLLGRLFVVPLLIVVMIVGCSLAVLVLFGWITESRQESLERLVERIEAGTGEKVLDVALLPKDREVWQAAMDLGQRLEGDEGRDLTDERRRDLSARLASMLEKRSADRQGDMGRELQRFMLMALGRLGRPESVRVLAAHATDAGQPLEVRRDAVAALMVMRKEPAARAAWPELAVLLDEQDPVLRLYATMAVGALADPGDGEAIKVLRRAYFSDDREVQWNAALALARLKDATALPLIKDMLKRGYWEAVIVAPEAGDDPNARRPLTPVQLGEHLMVTIDAAQLLGTAELRAAVEALRSDSSPRVKDHARKAVESWPTSGTQPTAKHGIFTGAKGAA